MKRPEYKYVHLFSTRELKLGLKSKDATRRLKNQIWAELRWRQEQRH